MKIACLGWGSLIWRPENLLIVDQWYTDGPSIPIEFARKSNDGRLTLVIIDSAKSVVTLWALMTTNNLEAAKKSLMLREGISEQYLETSIGSILASEETDDALKLTIKKWAIDHDLDAVIWTNLKAKFNKIGVGPTIEEATTYLKYLDGNSKTLAEEYIRKAPKQISTEYRKKFESEFGWTFSQ